MFLAVAPEQPLLLEETLGVALKVREDIDQVPTRGVLLDLAGDAS